ncbi:lytic murein transglycosylase [Candidatus Hepatincolaceae symbiont of Richtersius coronifer]
MLKVHRWFILLGVVFIVFIGFSLDFKTQKNSSEFDKWFKQFVSDLSNEDISQETVEGFTKTVKFIPNLPKKAGETINISKIQYLLDDDLVLKSQLFFKDNIKVLKAKEQNYKVPSEIIVAFLGVGSKFGNNLGNYQIINVLSTLASQKEESASQELLAFLKLVDQSYVSLDALGKEDGTFTYLGITPSNYLFYGVDGDLNGNIDLYNSQSDILETAYSLFNNMGWRYEEDWGDKILVPENINFTENQGIANARPLLDWSALGFRRDTKDPLPNNNDNGVLVLLDNGEGVLLYSNFNNIFKANNNLNKSVAVGLLSENLRVYYNLMDYKEKYVTGSPKTPYKYTNDNQIKRDNVPPAARYRYLESIK